MLQVKDGACKRLGRGAEVIRVRKGREEGFLCQIKEQVVPRG